MSGAPLRLFVGLRVGAGPREALGREVRRLADRDEALKPVREEDLHLTLQFLGAVEEERVEAIATALGAAAGTSAPMEVRYVGLGSFPERGAPRVLWAGLREARPGALAALATEVGRALAPLGLPPEDRAFSPHVTLARVRDGARAHPGTLERLRRGAEADFGADRLSDLKLILSPLGGGRYPYNDLTSHPLGAFA